MTDPITRRWGVRDAVLKWAYISKFQYGGGQKATAEDVTAAAEWAGNPLTQFEVNDATIDLRDRGYLTGDSRGTATHPITHVPTNHRRR